MTSSIVRANYLVTGVNDRHSWNHIENAGIRIEGGRIAEIGLFPKINASNPGVPVIGNGRQFVMPGLVNGHHHIGLTPVQLGSPDMCSYPRHPDTLLRHKIAYLLFENYINCCFTIAPQAASDCPLFLQGGVWSNWRKSVVKLCATGCPP